MNEGQVKDIALRFLAERIVDHQSKFGASQFRYRLHEVMPPTDSPPEQWAVVFLVAKSDGSPVDGPAIVLVDDKSGEAKFLD